MSPSFVLPFRKSDPIPSDRAKETPCGQENVRFRDVQHPRHRLNKIRPRSGRSGHMVDEKTYSLEVLIILSFESRVIIHDRQGRGGGDALEVPL
jgi:hypothetical protein